VQRASFGKGQQPISNEGADDLFEAIKAERSVQAKA
jgi:hypothetical protein